MSSALSRRLVSVLFLILAVSACGDPSGSSGPGVVVTDSLGVPVRTWAHTDDDLESWSVDPDPVLRLGALEGGTPDVFGRLSSLRITSDGGVVVSDELAGEIRMFSAEGAHRGTVGGLGEGPGEFSSSITVLRVSGDSVWAWDQRQQRVSVFAEGGFLGSWNVPGELLLSRTELAGSRLYGQSTGRLTGVPETGMHRPAVRFVGVEERGVASTLFETDGHERFLDIQLDNGEIAGVNVFQPPFARGAFFGVVGSGSDVRIVGGANDRFVLREWNGDGAPEAIHRYPGLDRPVTEARVDRARTRIMGRHEEPTPQMRQELEALESAIPDDLPAFDRVLADDEARLWVRRPVEEGPEEWLVLALPDLRPRGRIVLPDGFALLHVRGGLLGGRWLDDLEVPYARVYRLRLGG